MAQNMQQCPECSSASLALTEGCSLCMVCGYSPCK